MVEKHWWTTGLDSWSLYVIIFNINIYINNKLENNFKINDKNMYLLDQF